MNQSRSAELLSALCRKVSTGDISIRQVRAVPQRHTEFNTKSVEIQIRSLNRSDAVEALMTQFSAGSYLEDYVKIDESKPLPLLDAINDLNSRDAEKEISLLSMGLTRDELPPVGTLKETLKNKTPLGFPRELLTNNPILSLDIYIGASTARLAIESYQNRKVFLFNGIPTVFEFFHSQNIEFHYLTANQAPAVLIDKLVSFGSESLQRRVERYKISLKTGLRFYFSVTGSEHVSLAFFKGLSEVKEHVDALLDSQITANLQAQVQLLNNRIAHVSSRPKFFVDREACGLYPTNEHETVLLFDRILQKKGGVLLGAAIEIQDYSPKGIDSIARFSPNPQMPIRPVAAEFEFNLRNFFLHGHDPSQIDLVMCFTMSGMEFPFEYCGTTYELDRSGIIPRLSDGVTNHKPYVFILDQIFNQT